MTKNQRNILLLLIVVVLAFHFNSKFQETKVVPNVPDIVDPKPEPKPPEVIDYTLEQILDSIRVEDVKKYVETLSSREFNGRATGTAGNEIAAKYICDHLDSLKIPYEKQEFNARGDRTSNVIAHISPTNSNNSDVIVVGAHFDHLKPQGQTYYPGADDNASGTAAVMAIAEALNKYKDKLKHTIVVQFYSAEELGLLGSYYYVENPMFPKSNPTINSHIAMVNLDMVGYLRNSYDIDDRTTTYREEFDSLTSDMEVALTSSVDMRDIVRELSSKYSFANNISGYKPGGSDHAPFYRKGVPVVFLHTGSHPHYHRPSDTPEKLNYDGLASVARLALEIIVIADQN